MEFKEYSEIENAYRTKFISQIYLEGKEKGNWVCTLKVHGSNFSVYMNRTGVKFGKRSAFIGENNPFFNHEYVWNKQGPKIMALFEDLQNQYGKDIEVIFYGEIFGGNYPHKEVPKVNNQTTVQKGVYYSPENKFIIFDIKIDGKFLDFDKVALHCERNEVLFCEPLFYGTLEECLKYPNEFPDPLHQKFGLPPIENNICEGVVIKPIDTRYFNNGARVIIKNKNDKFKEVAHGKKEKVQTEEQVDPETIKLAENILTYANVNRLNAVISKIGKVTNKDFGKILSLMFEDIRKDYTKDNENFVFNSQLKKIVMTNISNLIRTEFVNLIDKE